MPKLEESKFDNKYKKQIVEVLKEVWETGETKSNQGLDLNWPVASKEDEPIENPSSSPNESPNNGSKIIWWIGGGVIFLLSISFLIYFLRKSKKPKKSQV